jgi:hypothetical protein
MKPTTILELKQQIQQLIDQLPPEQLSQLLQLLHVWYAHMSASGVNGSANQPPATSAAVEAEQPWLQYITRLKDSPNWDEFLKVLAEARHQKNEEPVGV